MLKKVKNYSSRGKSETRTEAQSIREENSVERVAYWDNIKGVMIILVVFGHFLFLLQSKHVIIDTVVDLIYMFHMPVFVFLSGYMGKSERAHSVSAIARLVFLYLLLNSALGFAYGFASLLVPMYSAWYLIALIAWRLTAHHIAKYKSIMLILFSVSLFAGFFSSIDNTMAIGRIIGFYPYYMAGYLLSKEKAERFLQNRNWRRCVVGAVCFVAFVFVALVARRLFAFSDDSLQMFPYEEKIGSFGRMVLWMCGFLMIYSIRCIAINKRIPFLTMIGRNSLWIFILHRPITLAVGGWLYKQSVQMIFVSAILFSLAVCLGFGNDWIAKPLNRFTDHGADIFTNPNRTKVDLAKIALGLAAVGYVIVVIKNAYKNVTWEDMKHMLKGESIVDWDDLEGVSGDEVRYPVMSEGQKEAYDKAFRITFAGDLILLEDQVKRANTVSGYDFSDVFEYASKYISSADFAIGVFEGPMAGETVGYSNGNFDDDKKLALNFPDEFAVAVKDAGFDLVTTANNHVLDKGLDGAVRTLDVLDRIGLDHIGSYRNDAEKKANRVKLVEVEGLRIAVLAYTYGSNAYSGAKLLDSEVSYVTSVVCGMEGDLFNRCKANVEADFAMAKSMSPDLIIVLPHMGSQFSNEIDKEQQTWFKVFAELGADIVLGDHPHVVEPVGFENVNGREVCCVYCPGNFANCYRDKQGDTSMLVDVYVDRDTKEVIGGAVVPLYTQAPMEGNYRALPIHDIVNDATLRQQLSTDDFERATKAHQKITEVVFGQTMDIEGITERYYFDQSGFMRTKTQGLVLSDKMREGALWKALEKASTVCFIGDSLTDGTKNGGCPWYEPIEQYLKGKSVLRCARGGATVSYFLDCINEIPQAELYVIAVGTNDVRYREEDICAMTADEYVKRMSNLKEKLTQRAPDAEVVFIAPWTSVDGDTQCSLPYGDKVSLNQQYSKALEKYCAGEKAVYIDANAYIEEALRSQPDRWYLVDYIHPNAGAGVRLYSEAALLYNKD
ncbi:MAG: CapA family protein [Lachnospiraceae bacterium]|nr:CapA family protein [Lachnospiraceae bacterium]